MFDTLYQGVAAALLASDTQTALALLQEYQTLFQDRIEGAACHAQMMYCAIQNANLELLNYLVHLPIFSDISFFKQYGETPLSLAITENKTALIPLLIAKTDKNFALQMAVAVKNSKIVQLLLSKCVFKDKLLRSLAL